MVRRTACADQSGAQRRHFPLTAAPCSARCRSGSAPRRPRP